MQCGEIFVPKIPSVRVRDLAESLKPGIATNTIGIRPGEKLHEIMCPADDSHLTLEFSDHYVIQPSIRLYYTINYTRNILAEEGQSVSQGFEYNSGDNDNFLTVEELQIINKQI